MKMKRKINNELHELRMEYEKLQIAEMYCHRAGCDTHDGMILLRQDYLMVGRKDPRTNYEPEKNEKKNPQKIKIFFVGA